MQARFAWLCCSIALACCALGCGDDEKGKTPSSAASSGGEYPEDDNMAVKVAPKTPAGAAPAETPGQPKPQADYSPDVGPGPVVAKTQPATPQKGPSPWGAPDAECKNPLPKRPQANKAARDALTRGKQAATRGDFAGAKVAYEQALVADPKSFQAAYNLAVLADRQGQTN
jgi:hypothetical protein